MRPTDDVGESLALLDDYDFELPAHCIAQSPTARREDARLMLLDRHSGSVVEAGTEHRVQALPRWLRAGDLLVLNTTRVLPARLVGRKASGGAAEVLLLGAAPESDDPEAGGSAGAYRALLKCRGRVRAGLELHLGVDGGLSARVAAVHERGEVTLVFDPRRDPYAEGVAPLPPYIRRPVAPSTPLRPADRALPVPASGPDPTAVDLERYQTVYARTPGAIAAPTAGLHLTHGLLDALRARGVEVAEIVLHVGAGTFRPLDAGALSSGRLHAETYQLDEKTAEAVERTRRRGGRVIAVGTTTTRVLESRATDDGGVRPGRGETDLFLRPGGPPFRVVDGLLTNFHLPRSSLLLLVAAFMGREPLLSAYQRAIEEGFRFYSYGDAMLILPVLEERIPEEAGHG
jgi:S-adenosylmethionine:tRNA ribosyltransferase-isomerase